MLVPLYVLTDIRVSYSKATLIDKDTIEYFNKIIYRSYELAYITH